jgi:ATP-dependent DNA helicase RecG
LFKPVTNLKGIGPRIAKLIERVAGPNVVDLIWHLPREIVDRSFSPGIKDAPAGRIVTLTVTVEKHVPSGHSRRPYRVRCSNASGKLTLIFFHAREDYLRRELPEGEERVISGTIEHYRNEVQMTHPDYILSPAEAASMPKVEPVYPLTAGLTLKTLGKAVRASLDILPDLPEWQDGAYLKQQKWPSWHDAVIAAHAPDAAAKLEPDEPARARLAFDELLANQLALALIRARMKRRPGRTIEGSGELRRRVQDALPFTLTNSQTQALDEIYQDMAEAGAMLRLLQGDVGSGKTVVALFAMLDAVECGGQAALMAPTEILARQHLATIEPLAEAGGIRIAILTGRDKGAARKKILAALQDGTIDIVVGTHALFQEAVEFKNLMMAVIDEQHRFGVHQRLDLAAKGKGIDVLVMTATPIPRTLLLTAYGDLESSRLTEKPAGRKPVDTRTVPAERLDEVVSAVARALEGPARIFWVCPLVEESEVIDLAAAEDRHRELKARFGDVVELVHGRMKGPQKDAAMARFAEGPARILVATTVIEVGVDIPEATIMVVEHAERFGLAQLHQLRGRIGRGGDKSTCLLIYTPPLTEAAKARLEILRETEDGFHIAEEDLRLRGGGELLGTRQSGLPEFRLADLAMHEELLAAARDDAKLILDRDPELKGARGAALRTLLYLFERDAAVVNLRSG